METFFIKFFTPFVLMSSIQMHGYDGCLEEERIGLLEIKRFFISINGGEYADEILTSWVDDGISDCCDWERLKCNATAGRVTELSLNRLKHYKSSNPNNSSDGVIILDLSLFPPFQELQSLDLSENWFGGVSESKAYNSSGNLKQLKILNLGSRTKQGLANLRYLQVLDLSWNFNITSGSLTRLGLANLTNLKKLDLAYCGITTIQGLAKLKNLEALDLSYNYYIHGSLEGLANLTHLQVLDLSYNQNLTMLAHGGFVDLPNLKELTLRYCGITTTQGLVNLTNLQVLDLSDNQNLTTIGLADLSNLKALDLCYCGITTIQGLANLTNLQVLDLSDNQNLTMLGFADLPNLKTLDLHSCGITTIQGICELKNLFELNLRSNKLEGHLPRCLNNLTHLKVLDISSNQLSGILPSVIANLTSLEYLALSNNKFKGRLFSFCSLANLSKLEVFQLSMETDLLQVETENCLPTFQLKVLSLTKCNLGVIPKFLLHQFNLKYLDLSHNKLVGNFPTWLLGNNTKLEVLYLVNNSFSRFQLTSAQHGLHSLDISRNSFSGKLPQNMGIVLPKLVYMNISKNSFEGNIPSSIGKMQGLRLLDVSSNNFAGELSQSLVINCFSLEWLDLSNNNFVGQIFPNYMNLTRLWALYLYNNNFSGKIKDGLLRSTELMVLDISNNRLSGHIPSWMGNFSNLQILSMSKNLLEGNIPVQFNNLASLQILNISENNLSGSMISTLNLSSVKHLYMQNNALGGSIPNTFFRGSALETLDLRYNYFFGRIPHQINEHSNLRTLLLRGNYLQGPIPHQLCHLRKLGIMDISHNRLNGSIPACITNMLFSRVENGYLYGFDIVLRMYLDDAYVSNYYNSTVELLLDGNDGRMLGALVAVNFMTKNRYESYKGDILELMAGLDLSNNELTGDIPSEIGDLQNIHGLNLSHNFLSGSIPESFSNLKMIESLDLSHNKLNGQIPPQLTELHSLSTFDVSYNNLSGPIPDKEQFSTFDESSYRGNLFLCGPAINKGCTNLPELLEPSSKGAEDESEVDLVAFYWSFVASCVTVMLGLLAILWVNPYWRRLWFYFIEDCIDLCYYWLFKYVFYWRS
ncbi:receptor-like protein 1 isoform X4 [Citrus sinensis]|uniref:receptor-like protein 1 isoform X4 n=1 Tax=Citrus sinensis TaxID=2711 RepID=UPI002279BFD1|nr:receptor-like protein 1 isoform X4 [Citrus sinensis]